MHAYKDYRVVLMSFFPMDCHPQPAREQGMWQGGERVEVWMWLAAVCEKRCWLEIGLALEMDAAFSPEKRGPPPSLVRNRRTRYA